MPVTTSSASGDAGDAKAKANDRAKASTHTDVEAATANPGETRDVHPNQRTSDDLPDDERIDRKATASRYHAIDEEAARNDPGKMPEPIAVAEVTDPKVQQILAEQQTAVQNRDAEGIKETNAKLRSLGYK